MDDRPGACEICEGCLDPRKFPNVTRGQTVCTACSEVLQREAMLQKGQELDDFRYHWNGRKFVAVEL